MTQHERPAHETAALQRIAARRKWLSLSAQSALLLAFAAIVSRRLFGERYDALSMILAFGLLLGAIGIFVYLTCFQRCPRCAGWIVIPKCPACGLKLEGARKTAQSNVAPGA